MSQKDRSPSVEQSKNPETARCGKCGSVACCQNKAKGKSKGFDQLYTTILGAVLTGASPQRWDKLVGEAWTLARKAEEQMKTPRNTDMP